MNRDYLHRTYNLILILFGISLFGCQNQAVDGKLVKTIDEFKQAVKSAKAGDRIVLANGEWKDTELLFLGEGTEENPISLSPQTKGKVILTGQSNLRLAGKHLLVEGLVFKDGYSPTNNVIAFRQNKENLCNNCRVTECVVDDYNNPERFDSDIWVAIYGKHNRFDHNHIANKRTQGVSMAVRLNTEESRENFHQIDHNYFGPRPILGSNGGETLRIGTSHYSLTNSNTTVEHNYFDRCNGEHEIISNKSGQNTFQFNTFYECQGTLTMRHGNETVVDHNYFFGNRKPNTGGIRIINEKQTVTNNYCEGLTGYRFRGALVIMNGVPNSPLNRYFQVIDSKASNNTFVDCDYIQLCAGSDEERSAVPQNTEVKDNIFSSKFKNDIFTIYDDISGIGFENNLLSKNLEPFTKQGFQQVAMKWEQKGEVQSLTSPETTAGFHAKEAVLKKEETGVSWYPKEGEASLFETGKVIPVAAEENSIFDAIKMAEAGDIIELTSSESYITTKSIKLDKPVTIRKAEGLANKPSLIFERPYLFSIENGGALKLNGLAITGKESPDKSGNAVIRTSKYAMTHNYALVIENCLFEDLNINHSFDVLKVAKHTFADSIVVRNSVFNNITGSVFALEEETDDIGIYNVENVVMDNCSFSKIGKSVLTLYRGGRDESTFGPILDMNNCRLKDVGFAKRNSGKTSVYLHGVQEATIKNTLFEDSQPLKLHLVVGDPVIKIEDCELKGTPGIQDNGEPYQVKNLITK
ncbi:MAG: polysaccharide lyase 6 family protein [Bacteroidota bacterium]